MIKKQEEDKKLKKKLSKSNSKLKSSTTLKKTTTFNEGKHSTPPPNTPPYTDADQDHTDALYLLEGSHRMDLSRSTQAQASAGGKGNAASDQG